MCAELAFAAEPTANPSKREAGVGPFDPVRKAVLQGSFYMAVLRNLSSNCSYFDGGDTVPCAKELHSKTCILISTISCRFEI